MPIEPKGELIGPEGEPRPGMRAYLDAVEARVATRTHGILPGATIEIREVNGMRITSSHPTNGEKVSKTNEPGSDRIASWGGHIAFTQADTE